MIDPDRIADYIREISHEEILRRFEKLEQHEIRDKSAGEMVTIADIEAERQLTRLLGDLYPGAVIAGEESLADHPERIKDIVEADLAFLIDPVDGTNNFIRGNDRFAMMVVALQKGEVIAGWIYLPVSDVMADAELGSGALLNGVKPTLPKPPADISKQIGAAHIKRMPDDLKEMARENLKKFLKNSPAFCAGYDYVSLLQGKKHFSVYFRTLPWDHLPGSFLLKQAGGCSRRLNEDEYTIHVRGKGLLSTLTEPQWHQVRDALFPGRF
ncbi:inositol monophosphatase family protein [Emcibacter sp.]|uniref:inositol monophosphatase family protein n=1 Tax=Emcibacter sp. TaxID=1979954 RepID=UPI002AA6352E|nr:inositol monophosphatase family protein [Emcibacter sp.]